MTPASDLQGWLPLGIDARTPDLTADWCRVGARRFTDPFFDDTVQDLMRDPFNLLFRHKTSLDAVIDAQQHVRGLSPSGFIFHMSRCGSTLVSQMLAALPEHIVLSEPRPVDAILRTDRRGASDPQRIAWLQAWMNAISQPRHGETRLFVKLDSWHIFDLPLLRLAFPDAPWIFLYRNPIEVIVSAMKAPGMHLVPGLIEMNAPRIPFGEGQMTHAEYMVRVLAQMLSAALEHLGPLGGLALDYASLPGSVVGRIAPHFNFIPGAAQIDAMNARLPFHAKEPGLSFEPDAQIKQQSSAEEARALCAEHLDPLYAQLREL